MSSAVAISLDCQSEFLSVTSTFVFSVLSHQFIRTCLHRLPVKPIQLCKTGNPVPSFGRMKLLRPPSILLLFAGGLVFGEFGRQKRQHFHHVTDDSVIGNLEDRCIRVLVDCDNRIG